MPDTDLVDVQPSPVRRCGCGAVIGDGDYASGHRDCVFHRRRHAGRRR